MPAEGELPLWSQASLWGIAGNRVLMLFGCPQATGSAAVGTVCATQTGQATTATAPRALTPACPATGWCAVATAPACVAAANAPSPAPMETPARSAPPVQMPAPSKSEREQRAGTGHTELLKKKKNWILI